MATEGMSNDELRLRHILRGLDEAMSSVKALRAEVAAMLPKQGEIRTVKIPPLSEYIRRGETMNGFSAICWFAVLLFATGIILFSEIRNANDGLDYQTYTRLVENHTESLKEASK